jgi:hypothetical protein
MVTLALTGIVPLTVDPEPGEVMVTTRLPTWAEAGDADNQVKPNVTNRAAAHAGFTLSARILVIAVYLSFAGSAESRMMAEQ